MYLQTTPDTVLALDATNGQVQWRYRREMKGASSQKMGLALHGDKLTLGHRQVLEVNWRAVGQHQMLIQIQSTIRPTRPTWCADHQSQHAVAPAADPVLVGFSQQIINSVNPFRIDLTQGLLGEIVTRIEEGK